MILDLQGQDRRDLVEPRVKTVLKDLKVIDVEQHAVMVKGQFRRAVITVCG